MLRRCAWCLVLLSLFGCVDFAAAQKGPAKSAKAEIPGKGPTADQLLLGQSKNDANLGTVTLMTQRLLAGPLAHREAHVHA